MRPRISRLVALALAAVLLVAACGDDDSGPDVEFGEGEIPASLPDDLPIPGNARIGSSLVDRVNNRTEVSLSVPADLAATVRFFQVGLVNQGYVVDRSTGDTFTWTLEFSRGELAGSVVVSGQGNSALAVISVNVS